MSLTIVLILTMLTLVGFAYAPLPLLQTLGTHRKAAVSVKQSSVRPQHAVGKPDLQE